MIYIPFISSAVLGLMFASKGSDIGIICGVILGAASFICATIGIASQSKGEQQ